MSRSLGQGRGWKRRKYGMQASHRRHTIYQRRSQREGRSWSWSWSWAVSQVAHRRAGAGRGVRRAEALIDTDIDIEQPNLSETLGRIHTVPVRMGGKLRRLFWLLGTVSAVSAVHRVSDTHNGRPMADSAPVAWNKGPRSTRKADPCGGRAGIRGRREKPRDKRACVRAWGGNKEAGQMHARTASAHVTASQHPSARQSETTLARTGSGSWLLGWTTARGPLAGLKGRLSLAGRRCTMVFIALYAEHQAG